MTLIIEARGYCQVSERDLSQGSLATGELNSQPAYIFTDGATMKPAKGASQMGWMDPYGLSDDGDVYGLVKMSVQKLARAFKPTRRLAFERRRATRYLREYFQSETLD